MAGQPEAQWAAILIPCLVGPSQQAVDHLAPAEVTDYTKVRDAILQTLNLTPEAHGRRLQEVVFGPDFHPTLTAQKIQN